MNIDFHTHILPGIDDGSPDLDHTRRMLLEEKKQGISTVIATPHFYADRETVEHFAEKRDQAYRKYLDLKKEEPDLPQLVPAAEVFYFEGIGRADGLEPLCAGRSNVLFLEAPFDQWENTFYQDVSGLLARQRKKVVLVHIGRFLPFQKDPSVLKRVLDLPLVLQINAGRFATMRGRRTVKKILSYDKPTILGSDCHNMSSRKPNLSEAEEMLRRKFRPECAEIFEQGEQIMRSEIFQETGKDL